ncbi:MAG: hypothetical protein UT32_C0012G0011 [Parcubacteria group bacterium GW2011_GWC2_39_14]|nr:MAG: hypothetical protein UT32_C0012G0011 [Parcubacteria group bacterium GW2011_GWC2_39_14]KKR55182.1 MAG: hypothetical protein UT91_C0004G0081 [Parcubacteria group bacterium GW2011_GWA2_40_23]
MQRGTKLILLVAIGVLIILGIIVFFILNETKKITPVVDEKAPVAKLDVPKDEPKLIKPEETQLDNVAKAIKPVAIAFVERFGTFTSDSNFASIRGLNSIMTESMLAWTNDVYIPKLETEHAPNGFFYRITAKAPVVQVLESTDTTAKIKVTAQREETIGTEKPRAFLQDILLDLVNVNNVWLVDAVYWQNER